jgi:hypothetical protein
MQRERIKWATLGDENTKFFHTTTTIRRNKKSNMVLKVGNGIDKFNYEDKTHLPWEAFKERLGTSEFNQMHIDLSAFINPSTGL